MTSILRFIFDVTIWVFVPLILILIIRFARGMSGRAEDEKHSASAKSGFWAGFILFVTALIYHVGVFIKTSFPRNDIFQGFSLPLALVGAVAGFIIFSGGKRVLPAGFLGLIVLSITFAAFYSLLHYLFIRTANEILLSLIMGITFGALLHSAFSPTTLKEFLQARSRIMREPSFEPGDEGGNGYS